MKSTMSDQCSSLFDYRSFSLFTPFYTPLKPYLTPFPFHNNLRLTSSRSKRRAPSLLFHPLAAQSSSDIVLVATTEHHDGSFLFQFGDACEVVKNDEVVEEIESQADPESNVVNILDGDQERQVPVETTERGYGSEGGQLTEVADGIRNADIEADNAARDTDIISDLRDYHAELSETLSDISEKEVLSLQSDAQLNNSLEGVESKLEKTESTAPTDGDESSNPTISLLDNRPDGTVSKDSDNETEDSSVYIKLESMQASLIEVMDDKQPYTKDELQKLKTEDTSESSTKAVMPLATMHISDVELTDAANEDVEEGLQDMNLNEGTLIDEMPPSNPSVTKPTLDEESMEVSSTKAMDVYDQAMEDELQQESTSNRDENDVSYVMPVTHIEEAEQTLEEEESDFQPVNVKVEETMEVSSTTAMDVDDEAMEDKLQQVSTSNRFENDVAYAMPVSLSEGAEPDLEDEVSQSQSNPIVLNPTMQVSGIGLQDMGQNIDEGFLEVIDETKDPSDSTKLETMLVSHVEVLDVKQPYAKDELHKVETEDGNERDAKDLMAPATIHGSHVVLTNVANEDVVEVLQDVEITEGVLIDGLPPSDLFGAEPILDEVSQLQCAPVKLETTMEVSTTKGVDAEVQAVEDELQQVNTNNNDENDIAYRMPVEPILEEEVSQLQSTPVEIKPAMQVSDIEVQDVEDTTGYSFDDGILQVTDGDASESYNKDVEPSSQQLEAQLLQYEGVNQNMLEQYAETVQLGSSILLKQGITSSQLESERNEDKVSSSDLAEVSQESETLLATEAKVKREEIYLTSYFLLSSGASLLEHPYKALTGGDDAYFFASSKWLGVADGVSKWSLEGTDAGVYAQQLMRTCGEIVLDTSSVPMINPVELLCRGVKETNMSGSSNVLIANIDDQALHVANIGDTGFLIIRHGAIHKKSSPLLHEFHFALQVEECDDPLQLVEEYIIELDEGDVVVSATDGLFDNLYEREILMIVLKSLQAGMKPKEIANLLATRAQEVGRSAFVRSPFSDAAQAAGYTGYAGGKPDNVAVIVSLVEKRSNLVAE